MGANLALNADIDKTLAVDLAEKGCKMGESYDTADSCLALASVYDHGLKGDLALDVMANQAEATAMAAALRERACMMKHAEACYMAATTFLYDRYLYPEQPDTARAQAVAKMGCSLLYQARSGANCYMLGVVYQDGLLGEVDLKTAMGLFEQGCARDSAIACGNAAELMTELAPHDLDRAKALAEKGCALDENNEQAKSCFFLGMMYRDGRIGATDGRHDLQGALFYFQKACLAQFNVSCDFASQLFAANSQLANPDGARFFAQRACDSGDCRPLGKIYAEHGAGEDDVGTTAHYLIYVLQYTKDYDPNIFGALAKDKGTFAQVISEMQRKLGLPIIGTYGPSVYQKLTFGRRFAAP